MPKSTHSIHSNNPLPNKNQSTQAVVEFNNIDLTLPDQRRLFSNLSLVLSNQTQGLIGRNGTGKSVITQLIEDFNLANSQFDIKGNVFCHTHNIGFFKQTSQTHTNTQNLADFLGITPILNALKRIELGDIDESLFQLVNDQWDIKAQYELKLKHADLPVNLEGLVSQLSGGQKTKLMLLKLFTSDYDFLVLDEPSNHLDSKGRLWLLDLMAQYQYGILLISHDRQLLRAVDCIYQLTSNGIERFGGNFDVYFEQNQININALNNQVNHLQKELKLQKKQQQQQLEKSEQSQKSGLKNKKSKSHSKMAYDAKKENAQNTSRKRIQQTQSLNQELQSKLYDAKEKMSRYDSQSLVLNTQNSNGKQVLFIEDLMLDYVNTKVNLTLNNNEKLFISGENGSGKSTLLSMIHNNIKHNSIHCNKKVVLLDQHYSLLDQHLNALENLKIWLSDYSQDKLRILLANIGLRRERVFLPCHTLSGGEQLKLAWLCISSQTDCLLLLDEPDNHLDIESKLLLQDCLQEYSACFILVSHDEDFVNAVGINKIIKL